MKFKSLLLAAVLSVTAANASDVLKKSMDEMQSGIELVQYGFINNNADLVKQGLAKIKEGNDLFSDKRVIKKYLPRDKAHMVNIAENASKRIHLDANIIELNLDDKAYTKAAEGYSDMLNACSRCHGIVRSW
jgi:predicted CopG family antitoxin